MYAGFKRIEPGIGVDLGEEWGMAEQEYGPQHSIIKKLSRMYADAQALGITVGPYGRMLLNRG